MDNLFVNCDCMDMLQKWGVGGLPDLILTDIPYDGVNRKANIRELDKGNADIMTFDLHKFLDAIYAICGGTVIVFCGKSQVSEIFDFFEEKDGTVRQLIWEKTNPSPMNGQYVYLSGIENAIWFRRKGRGAFNAHCRNTVFRYPIGRSRIHPTEKNHELLAELIRQNSNEGDLVFDPCAGSGSTLLVAKKLNRRYIGCELNKDFYALARKRLDDYNSQGDLFS